MGKGKGERVSGLTTHSNPERPRRLWTTTRTTTMLRQWKLHHCTATSILLSCCFNCCAEQSHEDNVHSTAVEEQLKQKKSNFQSTADLSWALLRIQLTSLLLISPGPANESLTSLWESSSPPSSWSHLRLCPKKVPPPTPTSGIYTYISGTLSDTGVHKHKIEPIFIQDQT